MIEPVWRFKSIDEDCVKKVAETFSIPHTIARVMSLRGIQNRENSKKFFYPHLEGIHDPFLMKDMEDAVSRILQTISEKKSILIFGDYDVDGTTSAAFLTLFFQSLEVDVHYYIPSREKEGYGVSKQGIEYGKLIGADILITCDCGINAFEQVDFANSLGIDVIISDHHKPEAKLPDAAAVINPNRLDCNYPFKGLCGAGVAFKLALALCQKGGYDQALAWKHSDLITLGIAADLVPIKDENRIIVHYGIKQMQKQTNSGITALLKTGGLWKKEITVGRLVFWMAPKINAAGRLGDASRAVKLLTTNNPVRAMDIARELEDENNLRKEITHKITEEALYQVKTNCNLDKEKAIILGSEDWHPGVVGIVASRIKETFARPAIIISFEEDEGKGSCRSIYGFDMVDALRECASSLTGFGGHPIAAGLSLQKEKFDAFKATFLKVAENQISTEELTPTIMVDSELNLEDLDHRMLKFLNSMEPYGPGNMRPIFTTKNIRVEGIPQLLGRDQNTLKFSVKQKKTPFESIGFNMAEHYEKLILNSPIDIAYVIGENEWNGKRTVQLELKDIKLSNKNGTEN
ncbi:MAG: single-stranded-DNA-specific exonuclease RecJ [Candidatus Marinimicrobia bacterium]|nr:single-stranded-DNA-specific exonuclease RecJ [Candidatus Neomarinimicrobiota bacterium]MDP6936635.1 single-stranded-DNA-specific exonuclease RecJ [Candidatus Neomarinimicrobiota bacterium]